MFSHASRYTSRRLYSVAIRKNPRFADLFRTPVFKTLLLTLVFGSAVVECTKNRKEIEGLQATYRAKNNVLRDVTQRIINKEPVDVASEVNVANSMTRNKYHSVTDVHLDESFESFLKMADEDLDLTLEPAAEVNRASPSERRDTSKFL